MAMASVSVLLPSSIMLPLGWISSGGGAVVVGGGKRPSSSIFDIKAHEWAHHTHIDKSIADTTTTQNWDEKVSQFHTFRIFLNFGFSATPNYEVKF